MLKVTYKTKYGVTQVANVILPNPKETTYRDEFVRELIERRVKELVKNIGDEEPIELWPWLLASLVVTFTLRNINPKKAWEKFKLLVDPQIDAFEPSEKQKQLARFLSAFSDFVKQHED